MSRCVLGWKNDPAKTHTYQHSMLKPTVLRTKLSYTLFSVINLTVVVALLLAIAALVKIVALRVALLGLTYMVVIVVADRALLRLWRNKIVLDDRGLSASIDRSYLHVRWDEIEAIWQPEAVAKIGILRMTTPSGTRQLYLSLFDKARTWDAIRSHIPAEALQAGSYKQEPSYHEFQNVLRELIANYDLPLGTVHGPAQAIGWLLIGLFIPLALACLNAGLWVFVPLYILFSLLIAVYLLAIGRTEVDLSGVTHYAWFGRYRMDWDEITELESSPLDTWMILHGEGKRLSLPGIKLWSGIDRGRMLSLYMYVLAEKEVMQCETQWADFKLLNRGTRKPRTRETAPGSQRADPEE
jgi:hypothetical protein